MIQVIPAILVQDQAAFQEKVDQIRAFSDIAQIDVMDGQFVPNTTYADPSFIRGLPLKFEAHLMITRPELHVMQWNLPNVVRIIVHYEAVTNVQQMIRMIKDMGKEVGIALNPETPARVLEDVIGELDMVMVMGVSPGFSGQKFQYDTLEKMKELKQMRPDVVMSVDGGVNAWTARHMVAAGVDILSGSSSIFSAEDPKAAFHELEATEPAPPRA